MLLVAVNKFQPKFIFFTLFMSLLYVNSPFVVDDESAIICRECTVRSILNGSFFWFLDCQFFAKKKLLKVSRSFRVIKKLLKLFKNYKSHRLSTHRSQYLKSFFFSIKINSSKGNSFPPWEQ